MKKLLCAILVFVMTATLCAPVTAVETESPFVPETFTREELLAMDPELDSDNDGLVDVIELVYEMNRYDADTDGDGVSDYTEFCVTCTDPLTPDGHLDTDGDGLTNAQEAIYGTNPDDLDTDNDNLGDYAEIMTYHTDPLVKDNNTLASRARPNIQPVPGDGGGGFTRFSSTLNTSYETIDGYEILHSPVSYDFETSWFFANNKTYNQELAITSSLLATIAYDDNYLSNVGTTYATSTNAVEDWFDYHGFTGYDSYDLDYDPVTNPQGYQDQHVSEMFVANKSITQNGVTKNLVCVVVRGTNDTLDEWQSDFDIGTTANYSSVSEWTNSSHHMGFDITANRLNDKLDDYMQPKGFNSSNTILWITGHSRGAALTNLLAAKRINSGYNVFAYAFATPGTTTYTGSTPTKYDSIFNIINLDDFVPQLPLHDWGFTRYGQVVPGSIENSYASDWDELTGKTYVHAETAQTQALTKLSAISNDRNSCYVYPSYASSTVVQSTESYPNTYQANAAATMFAAQYPAVCDDTYRIKNTGSSLTYYYYIEYQPAMLMMLMAEAMSDAGLNNQNQFRLYDLPNYLDTARDALVSYGLFGESGVLWDKKSIAYPHYLESYYTLACNLSEEDIAQ